MFNGIGLLLGFVMQRSRFCFTAAFRDLFMFNSGRNMKGVIVGMAVVTVGFCLIMANLLPNPTLSAIALEAHANPVGLHLVLGGLLFGVGMVAAGGCTSARDGYFAYLPEGDQDTVAMLDMRTLRVVRRVDMRKHAEPHMLRVARDDKGVWVANAEANSVVVLDAKTLRPLAKIAMGKVPVTLAFTPDHQFAYVSH